MLNPHTNQRGFSMVELLIGIAILAILAVVGAPSLTTWMQNAQLRTAAEITSDGLQLAKAEAVRRNTQVQFSLPGATTSWSIGCATPSATCPATIQSRSGNEGTSNVTLTTTANTVTFNGLGRASNAMSISLVNNTGGACQPAGPMRCLNILVSAGGQIRMCNPALPSTNPQGC